MKVTPRAGKFLSYLIITSISILVYKEVLYHNFVSDDWALIVRREEFINDLSNIKVLFLVPQDGERFKLGNQMYRYLVATREVSYRPLNTLSYFIDYRLWGLNPLGYHFTNLTIHILNALLVYQLGLSLGLGWPGGLVAGLVFALHPLQVEPLAVASFREDILACFFLLVSVLLFLSVLKRGKSQFKLMASFLCYFLAILCKENALVYPLIITGLIFLNLKGKSISQSIKFYLIAMFILTAFFVFIRFHYNPAVAVNSSVLSEGLFSEILTVFHVFAIYFQWVFIPWDIKFYLVNQAKPVSNFSLVIFSDIIITAIILVFLFYNVLRGKDKPGFAALWITVNLFPLVFIRYLASMLAARYLYIPLVGFAIFMGILTARVIHKKRYFLAIPVLLIIAGYGLITTYSLRWWENDLQLWRKMANDFPHDDYCNFQYHTHRGGFLHWQKKYIPALKEYLQAYEYQPQDKGTLQKIGDILYKLGEYHQAIKFYSWCLQYGGGQEIKEKLESIRGLIDNED